jgi:membrane protease YdiL (CAAX protease family)
MMFVKSLDGLLVLSLLFTLVPILVVLGFCFLFQKRNPRTIGFIKKKWIAEYLWGLLIGMVLFSFAVILCVFTGALKFNGFSDGFSVGMFVLFFLGFMIQGMEEEVLCRGYLMVSIARRSSLPVAIIINSLIFAALHLLNTGISVLAFINLTLFGIFASIMFVRRGSIWMVGAVHSIWNFVQGNVFGIKVSGMELDCRVLDAEMIEGMSFVNGGAFGLEGGIAVTIVLLAGIVLMSLNKKDAKSICGDFQN